MLKEKGVDMSIEFSTKLKTKDGYPMTKEQELIIKSTEDRIVISALAGSAKSSTLYYYARERMDKNFLYLVYNKAMQLEAEKLFSDLPNVVIKTVHSLAYSYVGRFYRHKLTFKYSVFDVINDLNLKRKDYEKACVVLELMKEFYYSDEEFSALLEAFPAEYDKSELFELSNELFYQKQQLDSSVKIEHDFYLKIFSLRKVDLSEEYDILMVDECQDSNLATAAIIKAANTKGLVLVGDNFQQIYQWRGATNIMPLFEAKEYKLTTSFRVGQDIADLASVLLNDFISGAKVKMNGFNTRQTIVDSINKDNQHVYICRLNATIFEYAAGNLDKNMYFEGGVQGYKFDIFVEAYEFSIGNDVNDAFFKYYVNWADMKQCAKMSKDAELFSIIKIVEKYGNKIPEIVDRIKMAAVKDKEKAAIIFTTVHKAKGATYKMPVLIASDHVDLKDDDIDEEEIYIVYVAVTRAASEIELSRDLKQYKAKKKIGTV